MKLPSLILTVGILALPCKHAIAEVAPAGETNSPAVTGVVNPEAMEQAVRSVRKKAAEMEGRRPTRRELASPPASASASAPTPAVINSPAMEGAVQSLREKAAEMEIDKPVPTAPTEVSVFLPQPPWNTRERVEANDQSAPPTRTHLQPRYTGSPAEPNATIQEPEVPSKPKQQRLSELLQLYKDDRISMRQYEERREKILQGQ
jgi:hypothetical protein